MATRYLVHDVAEVLPFYLELLGFELVEQWGPTFAIVKREDQTIWLSGPQTSAAQPLPDGQVPVPGGWNRVVLSFDDFEATVSKLRSGGAVFRKEPISGPGGTQVLIEDPSGNPIEIFSAR